MPSGLVELAFRSPSITNALSPGIVVSPSLSHFGVRWLGTIASATNGLPPEATNKLASEIVQITFTPSEPDDVVMEREHKRIERLFDSYTGTDLGDPRSATVRAVDWIADLHDNLLAGRGGRLSILPHSRARATRWRLPEARFVCFAGYGAPSRQLVRPRQDRVRLPGNSLAPGATVTLRFQEVANAATLSNLAAVQGFVGALFTTTTVNPRHGGG